MIVTSVYSAAFPWRVRQRGRHVNQEYSHHGGGGGIGYFRPDWDYDPFYSWILGAQINRPEYGGGASSRWARWDVVGKVQL